MRRYCSTNCSNYSIFALNLISGGIHSTDNETIFEFDRIADESFNFSNITNGEQRIMYASGNAGTSNSGVFKYFQMNVWRWNPS